MSNSLDQTTMRDDMVRLVLGSLPRLVMADVREELDVFRDQLERVLHTMFGDSLTLEEARGLAIESPDVPVMMWAMRDVHEQGDGEASFGITTRVIPFGEAEVSFDDFRAVVESRFASKWEIPSGFKCFKRGLSILKRGEVHDCGAIYFNDPGRSISHASGSVENLSTLFSPGDAYLWADRVGSFVEGAPHFEDEPFRSFYGEIPRFRISRLGYSRVEDPLVGAAISIR